MKEIRAIIQPRVLDRLRDAFRAMEGFPGMSVGAVEGCSAHDGDRARHEFREELTDYSPKLRIEIVAADEQVEEILRIIHRIAHTGRLGDGVAWVTPVESFIRLRDALDS